MKPINKIRVAIIFILLFHFASGRSQTIQELTYATAVNIGNYSIDSSLASGSTPYEFNVGSNGASNFSVPLTLPPGNAGLTPELSLVYNSYAGNGVGGYGINLSCMSSITRAGKEYYYDGDNSAANLTYNDQFKLDGMRLIKTNSSSNGRQGAEYGKEVEDFSIITAQGVTGNGPAYFVVTTKDGNKFYYGNYQGSLAYQKSTSNGTIISWLLARQEDAYGNYIVYNYAQDTSQADVWLTSIVYTKNNGIIYNKENRVSFNYQTFANAETGYIAGCKVKRDKILKEITVTSGATTLRRYQLDYIKTDPAGGYPRLNKITEYGKNNEALNPIVIGWGKEGTIVHRPSFRSAYDTSVRQADFNSDGIEDILYIYKIEVKNPNGTTAQYADYLVCIEFGGPYGSRTEMIVTQFTNQYKFDVIPGDFNGDGLVDLAICATSSYYDIWKASPASNNVGVTYSKTSLSTLAGSNAIKHAADFDGDGLTDLFLGGRCYFFNRSLSSYSSVTISLSTPDTPYSTMTIDFDGDGCDELVAYNSDRREIMVNRISRSTSQLMLHKTFYPPSLSTSNSLLFIGHFNNDRYADIMVSSGYIESAYNDYGRSKFYLYTYDGINFTENETGIFQGEKEKNFWYIGDFNNDGAMDLLQFHNLFELNKNNYRFSQGLSGSFKLYTFNGAPGKDFLSFELFFSESLGSYSGGTTDLLIYNKQLYEIADSYHVQIGDYTGNGSSDILLLCKFSKEKTQTGHFPQTKVNIISFQEDATANLVTNIIDGNQVVRTISYSPTIGANENKKKYKNGLQTGWNRRQPRQKTVASVKLADKAGALVTTHQTFAFSNPINHNKGRAGFLGFGKQVCTNVLTGEVTTNTYNMLASNYNYCHYYLKSSETKIGNTSVATATHNVSYTTYSNKRYWPKTTSTTETDRLKFQTKISSYGYDAYNNVTSYSVAYRSPNQATNEKIESHSMTYLTLGRYPSRIKSHAITYSGQNMANITHSRTFTYNTNGKMLTETVNNRQKQYTYDSVTGVLLTEAEVAGSVARTTRYTYSADKKHVTGVTGPTGLIHSFTQDDFGNILTETAPGGLVTRHSFDNFNRQLSSTAPDGIVSASVYGRSGADAPASASGYISTSADGVFSGASYLDLFGRTVREVEAVQNGKKDIRIMNIIQKDWYPA